MKNAWSKVDDIVKYSEELYIEWTNNWLSVEKFAEHYEIELDYVHYILKIGEAANDARSTKKPSMFKGPASEIRF